MSRDGRRESNDGCEWYPTGMMMVMYGYGGGIEKSPEFCERIREIQDECEGNT